MASKSQCIRILQVITYWLWAGLFFLTAFSLTSLTHHFWPSFSRVALAIQGWVMAGLQFLQN
jgi:hypothetical protein